jgi:hypothetical protein
MGGHKTYTIIALSGYGEDSDFDIVYSGGDWGEINNYSVDSHHHTLILQIWVGAKVIRKFTKKDAYDDWVKEFDIMEDLKKEIKELGEKREKLLDELDELQSLTGEK